VHPMVLGVDHQERAVGQGPQSDRPAEGGGTGPGALELTDRPTAAAAAVTGSVLALCVAVPVLAVLPRLRALSTGSAP